MSRLDAPNEYDISEIADELHVDVEDFDGTANAMLRELAIALDEIDPAIFDDGRKWRIVEAIVRVMNGVVDACDYDYTVRVEPHQVALWPNIDKG